MKIKEIFTLSILSLVTSSMLYGNDSISELDSVTVTANKVEENLQDVPQSITVISAEMIEEKGIRSVEDIIREIPNMSSIPDRGTKVNFRGLNASTFTENNPVVVYIDGIPTSFKRAFSTSLINVQRIEVLRGPQSTLYGKDAIGGVINIITKEPSNEITGNMGVEYGTDNYKRTDFNVNTPIIKDKLFINVNGEIEKTDGWVTNTYNGDDKAAKEEHKNFATSLYFKASDKLSSRLVLRKEKSKEYGYKGYGIAGTFDFSTFAFSNSSTISDFTRSKAQNHGFEMPALEENTIDSQSLDIKYESDKYIVDAVTVHKQSEVDGKYDGDYTNDTQYDNSHQYNDASTDSISQEIRVSTKESDGVRWVGGVYFDKEEKNKDAYGTVLVINGSTLSTTNSKSTIDSETKAIFGQSMIPFDDKLELTLGGRYQKIKKEVDVNNAVSNTDVYDDDRRWNVFLPKLALNYKLDEVLSSFASISKGYMPGGFNSVATTSSTEQNRFEAQKSINYELGIKGSMEDFIFTVALFRMNIKDIHVFRQVTSGGVTTTYTDNADKAHSQGIEFDFTYLPSESLEISGAIGIIDTQYDSYNAGDNDFSGKDIETTPAHNVNLSVAYYHPNGFYARTDIKNQGAMYFYDDNGKNFLKEDGYTLVDAKLGYKFSDWDTYIYGKNLTDEEYINTYEANSVFSIATYGDPRFIGVGAKYSF